MLNPSEERLVRVHCTVKTHCNEALSCPVATACYAAATSKRLAIVLEKIPFCSANHVP